jgi:tRNA-specific 2-thiouridylase
MDAPFGLPGGGDSAVTALLLKRAGYDVLGLFMKNWEDDDRFGDCPAEADIADVQAIGHTLDIPVQVVNFAAEYRAQVFTHFLAEYRRGRTPNPDILCNRQIKFGVFQQHALALGAQAIATGHYAALRRDGKQVHLLCPADRDKDQTYFLHSLTQAQLAPAGFPLAGFTKREVRALATEADLPVAGKKDSTGICFIGERPFREFLNRYIQREPGPIKDEKGRTIGQHVGLSFYTLGQRQGLGIGGLKAKGAQKGGGEHAPWFVARKDMGKNTLWVVQGHDHPWLQSRNLTAQDANWIAGTLPAPGLYAAKTRYRQADAPCALTVQTEKTFGLTFPDPQWAVTPGQSAVLYDGEVCLGGGVIASSAP